MKTNILMVFSLFMATLPSFAQFKSLGESPVFDEPEKGFSKILQMKDGSTFFFHISVKDGLNVKVYDPAHKERVIKHIEPAYGKLRAGSIDAIFEVNGDATMLISEIDERKPVLYRLVLDGKTAVIKEESTIAELQKYSLGAGYAMAWGGVPPADFYVRKDAFSDHYAVAMFNSFESDRNKRIEIIFYGGDHKEVGRAFYASPDNKYKYLRYIDMTVIGGDKVSVLAYAYNTRSSGGKESELVLANLDKGSKAVSLQELKFSKDMVITGGITRYNPVSKKIVLLAAARADKRDHYTTFIATVDPYTSKLEKATDIYAVHANEKSLELFGRKNEFNGMPQNLFINADGSYSVVFEEITVITMSGSYGSTTNTTLGHIAVLRFNVKGVQTGSYLIPKSQRLVQTALAPFYLSEREGTAQVLDHGNQFKSFAYLNGSDKTFVLFNDVEKNGESVLKGKLTTVQGVGDCDGFYFDLSGKDIMPTRQFVFGKPDGRRENNLGLFAISDYSPEKNIYTTLKLEKDGRAKGVRVVWLQPQ